jgi:YihY family inner membrane protein
MKRLEPMALRLLGDRRVMRGRAVMDGFGRVGGGLLAAGIAFNALFALIPLAIFASGLIGILVSDPASQEAITNFLAGLAPPLASFLDQAIGGLANASTSLTIIGLIGAAWGATRLYSSVELGIQAMFTGVKARSIVAKTIRRAAFVFVIAAVIVILIVVVTFGSIVAGRVSTTTGVMALVESIGKFTVPYVLGVLALLVVYLVVPPVRPPRSALLPPSIAAGLSIVAISQLFGIVAPRLVSANPFYGTLGTVFVALAWLNLIASILLVGAAWVRVRMLSDEEVLASLA